MRWRGRGLGDEGEGGEAEGQGEVEGGLRMRERCEGRGGRERRYLEKKNHAHGIESGEKK